MEIVVKLYGQLRRYRPKDLPGPAHHPFPYSVTTAATGLSVASTLGIPEGFINAVAVNGEAVEADVSLVDGDKLSLFPPSAGGTAVPETWQGNVY